MNAPARAPSPVALDNHDAGNAERIFRDHGENVRYCHVLAKWFVWNGTTWEQDRAGRVVELAKRSARSLYGELEVLLASGASVGETREIERHARYSNGERGINGALALTKPMVSVLPEALDREPLLLSTLNATIDLRTGHGRPPRREDLITVRVPHRFDPDARCDRWELFLAEVTNDRAELVYFLQRWLGYCLTGKTAEHALVMLLGGGCNGKSVFVETVRHVFGEDLATTAPPGLLLASKGERHPTELRRLFGKRLVLANELPKGAAFNEERVKSLTGGDTISARGMREDFFDFAPTHKLMICTNDMPRVRDMSAGFWRRMRVVPFDVSFKGREDRSLPEALRAEAEGILAWMVRGAVLWAESGLGEPAEVRSATDAYREEEDHLGRYLEERAWSGRVASKELYADYSGWCEEQGERALSQKALGKELRSRGWTDSRTTHGRGWAPSGGHDA